jgi:hypothetical protein
MTLDVMASHEELAWVSNLLNRLPNHPKLSVINRAYDLPVVGQQLYLLKRRNKKLFPRPVEPWAFWEAHLSRFRWKRGGTIAPRRRSENDISPDEVLKIKNAVISICKYHAKKRFISKYTDFPRIKYLSQAFPDAIFIHLVRDGRAVSQSYFERIRIANFRTWNEREWWSRGWPEAWQEEWMVKYDSPLSFFAFQWKFFVHEIWEDAKHLNSNQYLEVNYRELVNSPRSTFNSIFEFCELEITPRVNWYIDHTNFQNMNFKWQERLSAEEKISLEEIISEPKFRRLLDE